MMSTRRIAHTNSTALYLIAIIVIVVAFVLLGGGSWLREMTHIHGGRSLGMANWNWTTILICLGLGFLLGWAVFRRR
jgi:hypothetical protein